MRLTYTDGAIVQPQEAFKRAIKRTMLFDVPLRPKDTQDLLSWFSPGEIRALAREAATELQNQHLLELDTDPAHLDGEFWLLPHEQEEMALDERTFRTDNYDGLLKELPDET